MNVFRKSETQKICFNFRKEDYSITRSDHLYEHRYDGKFSRDEFISDEIYVELFKKAISAGLRSFNNKDAVVINVKDFKNSWHHILCKIHNNRIFIITVYRTTKNDFWKSFIKVNYRIYLVNSYTIPKLSDIERKAKKIDKIKKEVEVFCRTQDDTFKSYMDFSNVKQLHG